MVGGALSRALQVGEAATAAGAHGGAPEAQGRTHVVAGDVATAVRPPPCAPRPRTQLPHKQPHHKVTSRGDARAPHVARACLAPVPTPTPPTRPPAAAADAIEMRARSPARFDWPPAGGASRSGGAAPGRGPTDTSDLSSASLPSLPLSFSSPPFPSPPGSHTGRASSFFCQLL